MKENSSPVSFLTIATDCLSAVLLTIYSIIIGPLGLLKGPLVFDRILWYARVLIPTGLLSRGVRTLVDWRVGNFSAAIIQAESIIAKIEDMHSQKKYTHVTKLVLADLYTLLTRAYLHIGHIDEAMRIVIRAKRTIGLERLPGFAELDVKTANLVRAGLAAGKLLDGGGLATMFVKTDPKPEPSPNQNPNKRSGASANLLKSETKTKSTDKDFVKTGKIIPFPLPLNPVHPN